MPIRPQILFTLLVLAWLAPRAPACQIPVFRYALERWEPSPYEAIIFHRGPLDQAAQKNVDDLTKASAIDAKGQANFEIRTIDIAKPLSKPMAALWNQQPKDAELPRLVMRYPDTEPDSSPLFAGKLDEAIVKSMADSPARAQIAQRLLKRAESAVWLLVESGNKEADDKAAKTLDEKLKALEKELKLPDLNAPEGPRLLSNLPVKIAFSVIRISRTDPQEKMLVAMLLSTDKDARESREPVVYTVFGRGRALGPVIGKDIAAKTITQISEFLIGECSCQVKQQNPGFDLLMSADWGAVLDADDRPAKVPSLTPQP